jgi:hypothetical protein
MIREPAWRLFAGEYNDATLEWDAGGEKSPSYVITPLGARVNRLFIVGVVTDVDRMGAEDQPMYRARLSDPTGVYHLYAGQYQPEASAALAKVKPPAFVAVVGKSRTYSPEEGVVYTSVRPEGVKVVEAYVRDYWNLETCRSLKRRLEAVRQAQGLAEATPEALARLGIPQGLAEGLAQAFKHYGPIDVGRYEKMLADSLRYLLPEYRQFQAGPEVETGGNGEEEGDAEESILTIVASLDRDGRGAAWDAILEASRAKGIDKDRLEEVTNKLLDQGLIFEPVLGKIKKV